MTGTGRGTEGEAWTRTTRGRGTAPPPRVGFARRWTRSTRGIAADATRRPPRAFDRIPPSTGRRPSTFVTSCATTRGAGRRVSGDVPPPSIDFSISSKNSVDRWWRARGEPVERAAMTGTGMAPAPGTPGTESIVVAENIATSTVPVPVPARVSRRRFLHDVRARASWATPREVTPTTPRTNATTTYYATTGFRARDVRLDSTRPPRRIVRRPRLISRSTFSAGRVTGRETGTRRGREMRNRRVATIRPDRRRPRRARWRL